MYPPGTTATATVRGVPDVPVMAVTDGEQPGWLSALPIATFTFHTEDQVTDVERTFPLVLREGDLDALNALRGLDVPADVAVVLADLQDRIVASRAGIARPEEPLIRGAVVVDASGREWVRVGSSTVRKAWFQYATGAYARSWDEFDPIKVQP